MHPRARNPYQKASRRIRHCRGGEVCRPLLHHLPRQRLTSLTSRSRCGKTHGCRSSPTVIEYCLKLSWPQLRDPWRPTVTSWSARVTSAPLISRLTDTASRFKEITV